MANFTITGPDGKRYKVSGENAEGALQALQQHLGAAPQAQPQPDTGMDMLKSAGSGLAQGAAGLVSMPAQLGDYLGKKATSGIDYLMGVPPEETAHNQAQASDYGRTLPNPANIQGPEYQPQTTAGRYTQTVGQFLPSTLAGGPVGIGAKLLGATTAGLGSEAAGQAAKKMMPEAEPYARLVGGLAGGVAPALARRAVTPLPVGQERRGLLDTMRQEGVNLTGGQASGRNGLRYLESELGGGRIHAINEQQGEQFTRAALKRAGISADRASPEVIDHAFKRIGNQFDTLGARNNLVPDVTLANDISTAVTGFTNRVPPSMQPKLVGKLASDILTATQNGMSGKQYVSFSSELGREARKATDPYVRDAYYDLKNSIDAAMERSIAKNNPSDLGGFKEARNQYRNMIVLEQAATGAGEKAAEGLISPSALRNATVTKHGRRNYARGEGDFADLARAGEATMKPLPQSGTAPRTAARALGMSLPSILGGGAGATVSPEMAMAGMVAGASVPYAVGRGLLARPMQRYLGNQLLRQGPLSLRQRTALSLLGSAPQISNSHGH